MEQQVAKMRAEFDEMRNDVKEIKDALIGNEFSGGKGLIQQLSEVRSRLEVLELWKTKYINRMIGLAVGSGIGLTELFRIIYALIK